MRCYSACLEILAQAQDQSHFNVCGSPSSGVVQLRVQLYSMFITADASGSTLLTAAARSGREDIVREVVSAFRSVIDALQKDQVCPAGGVALRTSLHPDHRCKNLIHRESHIPLSSTVLKISGTHVVGVERSSRNSCDVVTGCGVDSLKTCFSCRPGYLLPHCSVQGILFPVVTFYTPIFLKPMMPMIPFGK